MRRRSVRSFAVSAIAALVGAVGVLDVVPGSAATGDRLALNGHSPATVALNVAVTTGGRVRASGIVQLNTTADSFRARLEVPLITSSTEFDLRAVNGVIYLTSPNLANASGPVWFTLRASWPSLARYAHLLARPNPAILTLLANARVTHHDGSTTYETTLSNVALGPVVHPGATRRDAASKGRIDLRLTTGSQGEFTGLRASLTSGSATTTVTLNVASYNRPVSIVAPPASRATTPAGPLLRQLFSSGVLGSLVLPTAWLQFLGRSKLT